MTELIKHSNLVLRRATRSDLPRLLALLADDRLGKNREGVGSEDACYAQAFEAIDADPNQHMLVGEQDGRVIAMLQLTFIPGLSRRGAWRANIEAVRVDGTLRGQGIGRHMLATALQLARERACRMVQLSSDKSRIEAHRFYGQFGFAATHEGFKLKLDE